jgi:hypothetical protein
MTATTSIPRQAEDQGRPRPPPGSNTTEADRLRSELREVRYERERAERMGDERQALVLLCQMNTLEATLRKIETPEAEVTSLVPSPAPAGATCEVRRRPPPPAKQQPASQAFTSRSDPRRLAASAERQRLKAGRNGREGKGGRR